jgi:hypothetical protein
MVPMRAEGQFLRVVLPSIMELEQPIEMSLLGFLEIKWLPPSVTLRPLGTKPTLGAMGTTTTLSM